ncbi:MAG: hypothetical protein RRY36_05260 [Bacteroidaceae bacterium]
MKKNTIKKVIASKLEEWLDTITDLELRNDLRNKILVSGGCISSMFMNEPVNDYDVYLSDIDIVKRVAKYYTRGVNSIEILDGREKDKIIEKFMLSYQNESIYQIDNQAATSIRNLKEDQIKLKIDGGGGYRVKDNNPELKYQPAYFSPNAISLTDNLQIVLRFYGDHTQVHKTFDFVHATNYFTFSDGLVTNINAVESILTKTLIYQGSLYPLTSIIRSKKFIKRGFSISAGEYLKIMYQISKLDLDNMDILEEQLIGVDVAYFDILITSLRSHLSKHPKFEMTAEYLNNIIEKVFNGASEDE